MDGSFNWLNYIDVFHQRCSKYIVPSGSFGYSGSYSYGSYGFGSYVFGSYGFGSYVHNSLETFLSDLKSNPEWRLSDFEPLNFYGYGIDLI